MKYTFQWNTLTVLELNYFVKRVVNIVQIKKFKFFHIVPGLVPIVHEHLTHFVNWNCGVDRAGKSQFANSIWQSTKVELIGIGEKNGVDFVDMFLEFVDNTFRAFLIPTAVKEESKVVHFEQVAVR